MAILAGFAYNRRVMIQGYHGTGKSTHIEQVAARLNWPCVRVNLDSHISRIDLIGKDAIKLRDGKQVTEFHEGILPWALRNPVAIVFDEYDAGRADVMFVIQRVLEHDGKLTLLDQNEIITPNPYFRLFATSNTVGLGDTTGLYHGVQQINQAQMDRWSLVATLNYLSHDAETAIVLAKNPHYNTEKGRKTISQMVSRGRSDPDRLHERRSVDGDEPADGAELGAERRDLPQCGLCLPADLPEQVRRAGAPDRGRVLPALLRRRTAGRAAASMAISFSAAAVRKAERDQPKPLCRRVGGVQRACVRTVQPLLRGRTAAPAARRSGRPPSRGRRRPRLQSPRVRAGDERGILEPEFQRLDARAQDVVLSVGGGGRSSREPRGRSGLGRCPGLLVDKGGVGLHHVSFSQPATFAMLRAVPSGRSFFGCGTIRL